MRGHTLFPAGLVVPYTIPVAWHCVAPKSRNRIHTTKTQIGSVGLEIKSQIRMLKMSMTMQKSTKVMESMNALVDLQAVSATMNQLSKEMAKAGVIEEMIEEVRWPQLDSWPARCCRPVWRSVCHVTRCLRGAL